MITFKSTEDLSKLSPTDHHFNFWAISHDQLCEAGVSTEHIFASKLFTRCHTDRFFSYRGEGITGRFAAVIGLR